MTDRVQAGFEGQAIAVAIDRLLPTRSVQPEINRTRKFAQIRASIRCHQPGPYMVPSPLLGSCRYITGTPSLFIHLLTPISSSIGSTIAGLTLPTISVPATTIAVMGMLVATHLTHPFDCYR